MKLLLLEGVNMHLMLTGSHRRGLRPLRTSYRYEGNGHTIPAYLLLVPRRLAEGVDRRDRGREWHRVLGVGALWLGLYRNSCRLGLLGRLLGLNSRRLL